MSHKPIGEKEVTNANYNIIINPDIVGKKC